MQRLHYDDHHRSWLQGWLDIGPKKYGLLTGAAPNDHTHQEESEHDSRGCFVPGTLVLMANGTSLPIEQVTH